MVNASQVPGSGEIARATAPWLLGGAIEVCGDTRTYVRCPGPWRPIRELRGALETGNLTVAVTVARDLQEDGHPISLRTALELVALAARKRPQDFEPWALRWLARYITEGCKRIEDAADVAALLEELASEPAVIEKLRLYVR
jgi:hypothetical protein